MAMGTGWFSARPNTASAAYPARAFQLQSVNAILDQLFDTRDAGEDGSLKITLPREAENRMLVPIRVEASHSEKVAIIIEQNRFPLACVYDSTDYPAGTFIGMLELDESSVISCYALKQGLLYRHSAVVRVPG